MTTAVRSSRSGRRRGIAALWVILVLPCIVATLCLVIEVANLWMARAELEDGLEAAALAAVKEWGDNGGGNTLIPRDIGDVFANANTVADMQLDLRAIDPALNYNAGQPNDNATCPDGILLFGAITQTDPLVVFDASATPSCGVGEVLFDATSGPNMQGESSWGVNLRDDTSTITDDNVTIVKIVYDLRPTATSDPGDDAVWDLSAGTPPVISTIKGAGSAYQLGDPAGSAGNLDETSGVDCTPLTFSTSGTELKWSNNQIEFVFDTAVPDELTINFMPGDADIDCDGVLDGFDDGFEVGDRFRFGAQILDLGRFRGGGPAAEDDGDAVGKGDVKVTVTFADGGVVQVPDATGTFIDSNFGNPNQGDIPPADIDPKIPANAPYVLPITAARGAKNDNQSYVRVGGSGGGGLPFAVRAMATQSVPSICQQLFGLNLGSFSVSAKTTAIYDCVERVPRLIRVDQVICP